MLRLDFSVSFNTTAVHYGDGAKKQGLGCQGLGTGLRPEEAIVTCPETKPVAGPESEAVHCQRTGKQQPKLGTSNLNPPNSEGYVMSIKLRA